jgi:hypothetical protein
MPYLRDTRRSIGIGGFIVQQKAQVGQGSSKRVAEHFNDSVAFGNYPSDDHSIKTCTPPSYMAGATTAPFYVPFRALTHRDAGNLLVAGKTMAQSFFYNSASRLHPCEWSTGVAAGAAAVLMTRRSYNTATMLAHIPELQTLLNGSKVGQPLVWAIPTPPPSPPLPVDGH